MNNPFDQTVINLQEKQVSSDFNVGESQIYQALRLFMLQSFLGRSLTTSDAPAVPVSGFLGESLKVRPTNPASGQIVVKAGLGQFYNASDEPTGIGGVIGVNDLAPNKPLVLNTDQTITVPTAPSGSQARYDLVEVTYNRFLTDATSRLVFNAGTGVFAPQNVNKTLSFSMDGSVGIVQAPANSTTAIGYKQGIVASSVGAAVIPTVTAGYIPVGVILVNGSTATFDYDVMQDLRRLLAHNAALQFAFSVSMPNTGGSLVPTVAGLTAPPGVDVVAVGTSTTGAACTVYVFGFDPSHGATPILNCMPSNTTAQPTTTVALTTIMSADQTALAGANASTATKVAIGQPCIKITLAATSPTGTVLYSNLLSQRAA